MSYRLDTNESLAAGLARVAGEQLVVAAASLAEGHAGESVHEARKAFKRLRSVLQLARYALGDEHYRAENDAVRELSRSLARLREADALIEAHDKLVRGRDGAAAVVRERLCTRRAEIAEHCAGELAVSRRRVLSGIADVQARLGAWPVDGQSARLLAQSVKHTLKKAHRGFVAARQEPAREILHAWRRQVKHCRYMSELLAPAWKRLELASTARLEQLSELLGDERDLALLDDFVAREPEAWPEAFEAAAYRGRLTQRRAELQDKALRLGRKALKRRPPRRVRKTLRKVFRVKTTAERPVVALVRVGGNSR